MEHQNQVNINTQEIILLPFNKTQKYAWGCKDKNCLVGFMTEAHLQTYAQFWMGTHPNGPSMISKQMSLKQHLEQRGISQPQFLFKILSIQKCLSIQAHPNQEQAKQLNAKFPQIYVDDKDKPEMLLTLSQEFELFLGFLKEHEFDSLLQIDPFKTLSSDISEVSYKGKILSLVQKIVSLNEIDLKKNIEILFQNLSQFSEQRQNVVKRIYEEFQIDSGILVSFLLQHHNLEKGSCFGIPAGVPHAYVKGQCFELMKNSDNVVRLGLTPKKKDIPNLLKILKNNFDKGYNKIQTLRANSIKIYEWNSYSIVEVSLEENQNFLQIKSDSIGILIQGQACIQTISGNKKASLLEKSVIFTTKGTYSLKGSGKMFFASKMT